VVKFTALDEGYFGQIDGILAYVSRLVSDALPHMDERTLTQLAFDHDWFVEKLQEVRNLHSILTPVHGAMEFHLATMMAENAIVTGTKPWQRETLEKGIFTYYSTLLTARDVYFANPSEARLVAYIEVAEDLRANPHGMLTDSLFSFYYRSDPERRASTDRALEKLVATDLITELTSEGGAH
jgi:hypothetical protein